MDLRWWLIAVAGFGCLLACFALATLLRLSPDRRALRPLANIARLTRLPEYARAARLQAVSTVLTLILLVVLFAAAVVAASRPTGVDRTFQAAHPEDLMLCAGAPVTDVATGAFLRHYAELADTFETQRIGLTSVNSRVVPLTRDYQYAAGRFNDFAALSQTPDPDPATVRAFAAPVRYVDYAADVDDVLALCLTGFPGFEQKSSHRRSIVYLGPPSLRDPAESRPALFDSDRIAELADRAGVQINVVAAGDDAGLRTLAERTGGQFAVAADAAGVSQSLDRIDAAPTPLVLSDGTRVTSRSEDSPVPVLAVVLVVTALLTVTLVVLRR
ncbi:hypothetical protein JRC04_20780 [Mycolicibacterium sp. S2-37]|uniref:hypothetical protein n=1 Tax=Mycolicibacterium sp. S2-37 TaxID=2810297 RepID=UPI001A93C970|nr:hypothetical protein [Mycolicibacterium sp. S2-37]MBO0679911.1 hypothetical protein [Mycolicibacterium sp. S2-37]